MKRRLSFFLLLLFLCQSIVACDFIYYQLDERGAQEKEILGEVIPFEKNQAVQKIQVLLDLYGYSPGRVDGVLGQQTRDSIKQFQVDRELKADGKVSKKTYEAILIFEQKQLVRNGKLNIELMQEVLKAAEVYAGKVDGDYGPKTEQAVRDFQSMYGLDVDGKVGFNTLEKMSTYLIFQ